MSRPQHTPGPWVVIYSTRNGAALRIDAPGDMHKPGGVGSVIRQNGIGVPACGVGHANARLIAAAPAMLEALEAVQSDCVLPGLIQAIVADAIAKAIGEL